MCPSLRAQAGSLWAGCTAWACRQRGGAGLLVCDTFTWVLPRTFGVCDIPGTGRPHFAPVGSYLHQLGEPWFKEKGEEGRNKASCECEKQA